MTQGEIRRKLIHARESLPLYPRSLLPAATRKSVAGGDRAAGIGQRRIHDWNRRISAECYRPNGSVAHSRSGRVDRTRLANNYSRLSFNFGPTLLSWMEEHDPTAYQAMIEGDRLSLKRFGGHGSAIAQAYNHAILPLCNRRDKETQSNGACAISSRGSGARRRRCGCRRRPSTSRRWKSSPSTA